MKFIMRLFDLAVIFALANCNTLLPAKGKGWLITFLVLLFILINVVPSIYNRKLKKKATKK